MRIAFVLSSLRLSGGVLLVAEYANRLSARGHAITLVTPAASVSPHVQERLHVDVAIAEAARGLPQSRSPLALLRLTGALRAAIPPADAVIATHTPTVLPVLLARGHARRGWLYMDYPEMFAGRRVERFLLDFTPRFFDRIFTISQPLTDTVSGHTRAPIDTIRGGLGQPEMLFGRPRISPGDGLIRVLYVGDMRPRKGLREVLTAADQLAVDFPNLLLVIASKEPCVLETDASVEFHLAPSDAELARLYRSSDLFLSASWGEGLGYPPLEAMACGTPVVLTDSMGVRDYAVDGENCLMTPARNGAALAAAAARVLRDPALAARLAAAGRRTAARYDWERCTDAFEAGLREMMSR
ncbi:MAG: glycosyltransferase family 4 protein [Caldilineaceae bacterium]|nr:glycosyltransferase family 4 protein [Caldilineaceae bacterium]